MGDFNMDGTAEALSSKDRKQMYSDTVKSLAGSGENSETATTMPATLEEWLKSQGRKPETPQLQHVPIPPIPPMQTGGAVPQLAPTALTPIVRLQNLPQASPWAPQNYLLDQVFKYKGS